MVHAGGTMSWRHNQDGHALLPLTPGQHIRVQAGRWDCAGVITDTAGPRCPWCCWMAVAELLYRISTISAQPSLLSATMAPTTRGTTMRWSSSGPQHTWHTSIHLQDYVVHWFSTRLQPTHVLHTSGWGLLQWKGGGISVVISVLSVASIANPLWRVGFLPRLRYRCAALPGGHTLCTLLINLKIDCYVVWPLCHIPCVTPPVSHPNKQSTTMG